MARVRSPNYPLISLPEAINKVTAVYGAEQHLAAPKEVVAKHIGYASYHSLAGRIISAVEKYGLLEETNGDKVKVSPLAMSILYPASSEEKKNAIKEAAFRPSLFAAIRDEWQGERPSDGNLRVYLIRRKLASDALDRVIQIYRETIDLVTSESGSYDGMVSPQNTQEPAPVNSAQSSERSAPPSHSKVAPTVALDDLGLSEVNNFRIVDQGSMIQVQGLVDRKGLDKLLKKLTAYKAVLDAAADDDQDDQFRE